MSSGVHPRNESSSRVLAEVGRARATDPALPGGVSPLDPLAHNHGRPEGPGCPGTPGRRHGSGVRSVRPVANHRPARIGRSASGVALESVSGVVAPAGMA